MTNDRTNTPNWPRKSEAPIVPLAYRPAEAAAALGFSKRKLEDLTKQGKVPHARVGRCVLYPVRELEDWLTVQVQGGVSHD